MQGTGTQTDPYRIENWDDFFDMTEDTSGTFYILMNDLDGNDYNGGVFGYYNAVHANLDGNGHVIRNLYYMHTAPAAAYGYGLMRFNIYGGTWKNLTIENVQTNCPLFTHSQSGRDVYMENCSITAACSVVCANVKMHFTECTVSLALLYGLASVSTNTSYFPIYTRCNVVCTVSNPSQYTYLFSSCFYTSRLEMEVQSAPTVTANVGLPNSNSVLAIQLPEDTTIALTVNGTADSPSVMDSTLWGDAPTSNVTNCIFLSTEDMKNADALNAAGFAVTAVA